MTINTSADEIDAVCVTRWSALANGLRHRLGQIQVRDHLADIVVEHGARLVIIDTKVSDLDVWPAPMLTDPRAGQHLWLFLVSDARDTEALVPLPPDNAFFARELTALDDMVGFVRRRSDPVAQRSIRSVRFLPGARAFLVKMENGRSYLVGLENLSPADPSPVKSVRVSPNRSYFRATQESGNLLEVPWDVVLHHCEPGYEHYNTAGPGAGAPDLSLEVGNRVRELRLERGLSIARLAELAGMHRPNLSRLEAGRHLPSLETLERVADALGVPVARLVARQAA